jgi:hypothetical protein
MAGPHARPDVVETIFRGVIQESGTLRLLRRTIIPERLLFISCQVCRGFGTVLS